MNEYAEAAWRKFNVQGKKKDLYNAFVAGWTAGIEAAMQFQKTEHLGLRARRLPEMPMPDVPQFRSVRPKEMSE